MEFPPAPPPLIKLLPPYARLSPYQNSPPHILACHKRAKLSCEWKGGLHNWQFLGATSPVAVNRFPSEEGTNWTGILIGHKFVLSIFIFSIQWPSDGNSLLLFTFNFDWHTSPCVFVQPSAVAEDGNDADGLPFPATGVDITATTTTAG